MLHMAYGVAASRMLTAVASSIPTILQLQESGRPLA